jgi:molybdate transport system ATP-binding protein
VSIAVAIHHVQGDFTLDVTFRREARVIGLFGPSGAGKTTLLNAIAGLIRPAQARVVIDGRVLANTEADVVVPPHKRRIGYVFQEGRLFPHLSVRHNLTYGRWFLRSEDRAVDFHEIVELLGIRHLLGRRPRTLSGGEKQRVAIGRALLASPRLLLMDEPLASLDEPRRQETLPYIERLRDELSLPIVYVSHNLSEIERLTAEIVYLEGGRVRDPLPVAARPSSP